MGHIFNYSILVAIPSERRGERVNIGLIVFRPEALDVRVPGAAKLRSICPGAWVAHAAEFSARAKASYVPREDAKNFVLRVVFGEPFIKLSDIGWFDADTPSDYEGHVSEILASLVTCPPSSFEGEEQALGKPSKINKEIASVFRGLNVLAGKNETIDDHKITKDHFVSQKENLRADFAFKNGVYHVTATLDLRRTSVHIKEAAWKAMVLSEAKRNFGDNTKRFAVYAAPPGCQDFASHLELMAVHSDRLFNWFDPHERSDYRDLTLLALRGSRQAPPSSMGL